MELKVQLCVRKKIVCAMHTFKAKNLQQFSIVVANSNSASEMFLHKWPLRQMMHGAKMKVSALALKR